jgi:WD40 repeat protein
MACGARTERLLVGTPCAFIADPNAVTRNMERGLTCTVDQNKPGEIWAIAISADGQYLAGTSISGKVNVWSLSKGEGMPKIREYETKGSFGLCVDLVRSHDYLAAPVCLMTDTSDRAGMAASRRPDTRMDPSTCSTMKPVVFPTPWLGSYILCVALRSHPPRSS